MRVDRKEEIKWVDGERITMKRIERNRRPHDSSEGMCRPEHDKDDYSFFYFLRVRRVSER